MSVLPERGGETRRPRGPRRVARARFLKFYGLVPALLAYVAKGVERLRNARPAQASRCFEW